MIKKILIALLCIILLGAIGVAVWWFFLKPQPLLGSVDNAHKVSICIADETFYDVWVPNEAELLETDEHSTYRYDLLTVGVQDAEPLNTDYKVQIEGRWVFAESKELWLVPTVHGFEVEEAYEVGYEYEYTEVLNEETGEMEPAVWNDGPYPESRGGEIHSDESHIHEVDDYILNTTTYGVWEKSWDMLMSRLCFFTGDYVPHYYDDGNIFYATRGDYTVGMKYINYNTNYTYIAHGPQSQAELIEFLLGE